MEIRQLVDIMLKELAFTDDYIGDSHYSLANLFNNIFVLCVLKNFNNIQRQCKSLIHIATLTLETQAFSIHYELISGVNKKQIANIPEKVHARSFNKVLFKCGMIL